ncbi:MAG: hypothetical protein COC12_04355 [Rhodobacteraceae bacterium]|nr:MAG: hypothetical protein COC12_04355 [Paracoccaceae bacterium]
MEKEIRQFEILQALATDGTVAGQQLSDMLNVSLRTIYRDIEELLENGITIEGTRGVDGGYRLHRGIEHIVRDATSLQDVLSGVGKTEELPRPLRKTSFETLPASKVYVDHSMIVPLGSKGLVFETICASLQSNRALQITATGSTPSVIMPLGLVFAAGRWVLISSDLNNSISSLALHSLEDAVETALSFKPPRNFRAEDFVSAIDSDEMDVDVVEFKLPTVGEYGAALLAGTTDYDEENGTFSFGPVSVDFAVRWLISMGPDAIVVEPKIVRRKLKEYAEKILQNNS